MTITFTRQETTYQHDNPFYKRTDQFWVNVKRTGGNTTKVCYADLRRATGIVLAPGDTITLHVRKDRVRKAN